MFAGFRSTVAGARSILAACLLLMLVPTTPGAEPTFSHDAWTAVLSEYVDAKGNVDYERLAKDRSTLDGYIRAIETTSPDSHPSAFPTEADALAYYINAYNAQVFAGVLGRGPEIDSVWSGLISGYSFFVRMKIIVGGHETNLKTLEDEIIRARYKDPRIHAALNCASRGCPRLPQVAFNPGRLDEQLDRAMREFANDPRQVTTDTRRKRATISKIFDWFEQDFLDYERSQGTKNPTIFDYINRYRDPERRIPKTYRIRYHRYDKSLNTQ